MVILKTQANRQMDRVEAARQRLIEAGTNMWNRGGAAAADATYKELLDRQRDDAALAQINGPRFNNTASPSGFKVRKK